MTARFWAGQILCTPTPPPSKSGLYEKTAEGEVFFCCRVGVKRYPPPIPLTCPVARNRKGDEVLGAPKVIPWMLSCRPRGLLVLALPRILYHLSMILGPSVPRASSYSIIAGGPLLTLSGSGGLGHPIALNPIASRQSHYILHVSQPYRAIPQKGPITPLLPCTNGGYRRSSCPQKGTAL